MNHALSKYTLICLGLFIILLKHMPQENFFFTENPTENGELIMNRLPLRNTLNYMNRFSISENDQHEISGFFVLDNPVDRKKLEPSEKIRWRNEIEEKREEISQKLVLKLSSCYDVVNFFLSGNALFKSETGEN